MRINASAFGRNKGASMEEAIGSLTFKADELHEAKRLKPLYQELRDGNLGFWTALMWATREKKLTKVQLKRLDEMFDKVCRGFESVTNQP